MTRVLAGDNVEARIQRLHFLRNRIAHHEPIHERDLQREVVGAMEVVTWICADTYSWMQDTSRVETVLAMRP